MTTNILDRKYCIEGEMHLARYWLVRDESEESMYFREEDLSYKHEALAYHIKQGNYFSTLAYVLEFLKGSINDKNPTPKKRYLQFKVVDEVIKELTYLDKNYLIQPKPKSKN